VPKQDFLLSESTVTDIATKWFFTCNINKNNINCIIYLLYIYSYNKFNSYAFFNELFMNEYYMICIEKKQSVQKEDFLRL